MSSEDRQPVSEKFFPDRGNIIAAALMAVISLMIIPWAPLYLVWVLIVPILIIYWAYRSRTTVDDDGITINYAFRGGRSAAWNDIEGIGFKGARTYLQTTDGGSHHLPGVTFNSLSRLEAASRGRIPDAITAAHEDADGKMEVIDREGNAVLLTQEEYREHLAQQEAKSQDSDVRDEPADSSEPRTYPTAPNPQSSPTTKPDS